MQTKSSMIDISYKDIDKFNILSITNIDYDIKNINKIMFEVKFFKIYSYP